MEDKKLKKLRDIKFKLSNPRDRMGVLLDNDLSMGQKLDALMKMIPDFETKQSVGNIKKDLESQIISFKRLAEDFDRGAKLQAENVRTELDQKIQGATEALADALKKASANIDGLGKDHGSLKEVYSKDKETAVGRIARAEESLEKVWLEIKRLLWLIDQISQPQGSSRVMIFLAGVDLGALFNSINLIAGSGIVISSVINTITRQMDVTIATNGSGGGGGPGNAVLGENLSSQIATGNKVFTAGNIPNTTAIDVWVDGQYIGSNSYTLSGKILTFTSLVPTTEIFISYFYGLIVSMIVTGAGLGGAGTVASPLVVLPLLTDGVTIGGDGITTPLFFIPPVLPIVSTFKSTTNVLTLTAATIASLNIFNGNADGSNPAIWTLPKASTIPAGIYEFLNMNTSSVSVNSGNTRLNVHSGDSFYMNTGNGGTFSKAGEVVRFYCDGVSKWVELSLRFRSYQT